jgi:hypothetical protein
MKIDSSFEQQNAIDSIRFSDDGDSNEIEKSDSDSGKLKLAKNCIEDGIQQLEILETW